MDKIIYTLTNLSAITVISQEHFHDINSTVPIFETISLMFFKQECLFRSNTFVQVRMHMLKTAIECSCIHCEHFWKMCPFCRTRSMTLRYSSRYREHIHPYGCRRCPFYFPIGFNDEPWCPFTEPQIEVRPPERRTLEQIIQDP